MSARAVAAVFTAVLLLGCAWAQSEGNDTRVYRSLSEASQALRSKVLENYDKGSTPPQYQEDGGGQTNNSISTEPVVVELSINFHRVLDVDVIKSAVDLLTWLRLVWYDERLTWDPKDYAGLDRVWFWVADGAGMGETSEIWTPDIELWNQMESIKTSFNSGWAEVTPDGRVFWSRPGHLIPVCKFEGRSSYCRTP